MGSGNQNESINDLNVHRVSAVEYTKDASAEEVTVTTSTQTLEELLGVALPDDVLAVTLVPLTNAIRYNPAGAADATNSLLPSVYTLYGTKTVLDVTELYAGSNLTMGVIVHVPAFTGG